MSKSHPGVRVVQAKGYTPGRPDGKPLWIVWHTTEQLTETLTSAEAIANYIANPGDGRRVSYNFAADADSVLQLVECSSSPWAAGSRTANNRGIHYGLVGRASQTRLQWLDPFSRAMLAQVAPIARADQDRYGIPMRRCSVADLQAGRSGHTTHNECRLAFGGTTHTDPGPNFPWDYLFGLIAEAAGGGGGDDDDMARLTFFKADGKLWRSTASYSSIREITVDEYNQIKDRGDNFPDANGTPPSTDLILDPVRGGWTWSQIKAAYGEDEALLIAGAGGPHHHDTGPAIPGG